MYSLAVRFCRFWFKRLKVKALYNQLVFASPLALSFIHFKRSEVYDV